MKEFRKFLKILRKNYEETFKNTVNFDDRLHSGNLKKILDDLYGNYYRKTFPTFFRVFCAPISKREMYPGKGERG